MRRRRGDQSADEGERHVHGSPAPGSRHRWRGGGARVRARGLIASPAQATAYSVGQQLFTTAWNLILAIVLMCWAFGWSGGKELVETSYGKAKEEAAERSEARKAKKQAKKDAAVAGSDA